MSEKTTIARPYAQAVFELSREDGSSARWSASLALLNKIVADDQMQKLLGNPKIDREQLQEIVISIGGDELLPQCRNFVKVLLEARRLQFMPQILQLFEAMRAEAEGTVDVEVRAAYELDQAQKDSIAKGVAARLGRKVNINAIVDESLIGGALIRANDSVIDASMRGRLTELANELA